jgi:hypothetical protein
VDDSRIASSEGLQRTLHQPRKENGGTTPLLSLPPLFGHGTTLEANGTIVFDSRLRRWVMYCVAFVPAIDESREGDDWRSAQILRFTSENGFDWRSDDPSGREVVYPRTRQDLYDDRAGTFATHVGACLLEYDAAETDWPYRGWIWLKGLRHDRTGAYFIRSRDGIRFERGQQVLVNRGRKLEHGGRAFQGPLDTSRVAFDPVTGKYLASLKFMLAKPDPLTGNSLRSRTFLFLDRLDEPVDLARISALELSPPLAQTDGNFPFDEYYDNTAYRYGSHWLGELRIWHGHGDYAWSPAGSAYLKLMSSEDGLHWRRAPYVNDSGYPEVFLANGPEGGNDARNDGGYITSFHQAPLRFGDELIYYYGASSFGKNAGPEKRLTGGGIFRARLRLDGFVSVDAGRLTTPAFRFDGDTLKLNHVGAVRVEVLDEAGGVLATAPVAGDAVRGEVKFDGARLRRVAGDRSAVRLRFTVEPGAALYAFVID